MTTHELKTWPRMFQAIWDGEKTYEVRLDDRGFQRADQVRLREWDPDVHCSCRNEATTHSDQCPRFTGRWLTARIGFVTATTPRRGGAAGFNGNGYVVFSLILTGASDPARNEELTAA